MNHGNHKSPKPLASAISTLLKELGIEGKLKQYEALNDWAAIVGEKISNVTTAEKVQDGILYIKVKNSAWRNELLYMKSDIL
ncbi:MAG: DUF721 domain-containing protein, partial [Nitrospinota bacterium]